MKNNKALITLWKHLNYEDCKANIKCLDDEEIVDLVNESTYEIIDEKTCLVVTDDVVMILTRSGLAIVNKIEVNREFL